VGLIVGMLSVFVQISLAFVREKNFMYYVTVVFNGALAGLLLLLGSKHFHMINVL
jgi:hypothetical protein